MVHNRYSTIHLLIPYAHYTSMWSHTYNILRKLFYCLWQYTICARKLLTIEFLRPERIRSTLSTISRRSSDASFNPVWRTYLHSFPYTHNCIIRQHTTKKKFIRSRKWIRDDHVYDRQYDCNSTAVTLNNKSTFQPIGPLPVSPIRTTLPGGIWHRKAAGDDQHPLFDSTL